MVATARLADLEHPWLGLESFREETRAFFFGRDTEIAEIHLRWRSHPLLVLYGRSGLGKTSILTAGVMPRLRAEGHKPLLVRLRYEEPANDPVEQLVNAISPNEWFQQLADKVELELPGDPASMLWLRLHYRAEAPAITHLILDQFEEVFTLAARRPGSDTNVRDALAIFLQGLAPEPIAQLIAEHDSFSDHFDPDSVPVRVILALRDDYVYALNRWRRHLSALGQNSYELRALRGTAAFDAVYKPGELRCANSKLPPIVDKETAERIVRFVAKKDAAVPLEEIEAVPPILSLLCRELNERRLTSGAGQINFSESDADIGTIISAFYERCLADKPEAVRIFIEEELVSVSGARLAQDESSVLRVFSEGCEIPGAVDGRRAVGFGDMQKAHACLHELVNERLLNSLGGAEVPAYELIHDLLASVAEKSRTAREQRFEKEDAERAKEKAQTEARRFRKTAMLVTLLLIAALIAGVIGFAQKRRAEEATARATRARDDAERLIEFMTFDLRDKLQPIGRLDLLHDVNLRLAEYYASSAKELETADGLRQRGAMWANEGNVALQSGDLSEAEKDYGAFLAISEKLCAQDPKSIQWQRDLALAHSNLGSVQDARGDVNGALGSHQQALSVLEPLVRQTPDDSDLQRDLARTYFRVGNILREKGDQDAAYKNFQEARTIQQKLVAQKPDDSSLQLSLYSTYDALADAEMARGNLEEAAHDYWESLNFRNALAQKNPGDLNLQRALSDSMMNMAGVQKLQDDFDGARNNYEKALTIRRRLAEQDPRNANWSRGVAESFEAIGDLQASRGDLGKALENYKQSLTRREQLCQRDPNNANWQWDRSGTLMLIGDVAKTAGQLSDAFARFSESLKIRQRLLEQNPSNAAGEREICVSYDRLGEVQQTRGNLTEGLKYFRQFVTICERLVRDDPSNKESQSTLCYAYSRVAEAIHTQGDYAGALEMLRDILARRTKLAQQNQQNTDWQWNIILTQSQMADMFVHRGEAANALEILHFALTSAEALLAKDPENVFHRWSLADLHGLFAQAYALQNNFDAAVKDGAAGIEIAEALWQQDQGNADWQIDLANDTNEFAKIQLQQGDSAGAEKNFEKSRALVDQLEPRAPENAMRVRQRATSVHGVGDVQRLRGERNAALNNYREALGTREGLVQRDQTNAFWQGELALTCWRMGETMLSADPKSRAAAIQSIERGREILRDLKSHSSLTSEQQSWLDEMEGELAKLREKK